MKYEITATIKKNRSQQKIVSREITVPSTKDVQDLVGIDEGLRDKDLEIFEDLI